MSKPRNKAGKFQPPKGIVSRNKGFAANVPLRGRSFVGTVVSAKRHKTIKVEWTRHIYIPKYERYELRRTRVHAHNPESINAKEGEMVRIIECRPISKTKHFVVIEKLGDDRVYREKQEMKEIDRTRMEEKDKKKTESAREGHASEEKQG